MTASPVFAARPLDPLQVPEALELCRRLGVPGIYLQNYLLADAQLAGADEVVALHGQEQLLGLLYCGGRGNLIILTQAQLDPAALAQAVLDNRWSWRIVLGPGDVVAELRRLQELAPLVHRTQIYYAVAPAEVPQERVSAEVRVAERPDHKVLVQATLQLNETDLGVDAWRVNKDWVKKNVRDRIRDGTTLVIGPVGAPRCKLDIGSIGAAGLVVEGVYTWPEYRSQGLASTLVATVAARAAVPVVCLHVAEENLPARKAYEHAGMRESGACSLMLRS